MFDNVIYRLWHEANNFPYPFINKYSKVSNNMKLSLAIRKLLLLKAYVVICNFAKAIRIAQWIIQKSNVKDDFILGATYLQLYYIYDISGNESLAKNNLQLAEKHIRNQNDKILWIMWQIALLKKSIHQKSIIELESWLKSIMSEALKTDFEDIKKEVLVHYIIVYFSKQQLDKMFKEFSLFVQFASEEEYPYLFGILYNIISIAYLIVKDYSQAEAYIEKAECIAKKHGYFNILISNMINKGILYKNVDKISESIDIYNQCLQLQSEYNLLESENTFKIQDNLATSLTLIGKNEEALEMQEKSLLISIALKNTNRENLVRVNIANTLINLRRFKNAEKHLQKAIKYFTEIEDWQKLIIAFRCMARLYEEKKDYKKAFESLESMDEAYKKYIQTAITNQSKYYTEIIEQLKNENLFQKINYVQRIGQPTNQEIVLIGEHQSIKKAISNALLAAKYPKANVLITGESGTGKEIIAQLIHTESNTGKPMVAINASAIPSNLLESELFGHKKGAFTGAVEDKKGKFLLADNGTLFLDEISEMPIECQAKLLRAIETGTIQPVGSNQEIKVSCRIISTSNCNIKELIKNNKFRLDLFHRLNKIEIQLLPLRDRFSDIELLCEYFITRFAQEFKLPVPKIDVSFYNKLKEYSFPGNVRELKNIIERIYILYPNTLWTDEQLSDFINNSFLNEVKEGALDKNVKETEYQTILKTLQKTNWVQKEAAKLLGIAESTLTRKIQYLGIKKK